MSRKIELSRLHALNWFGYSDVLDVHGNLLIAGVTGSGKSVLMDLIQLVLVGDQKSKYNQSATGSASTRSLKSYCLGDTKQDIDGTPQYMRDKGAITYAALEFRWPKGKRVETWGLRIEFDSAAQNQPNRKNGFCIPGRMEKDDWLHDDRTPLDFATFKNLVNTRGGTVFDTMDSYRREMAIPSHLNFDRSTLDYLLPAAMSFTFLRSFNDFCRQYILPADSVDIQPVKESFQAFRSLERELGILRDQLERLQQIDATDGAWQQQTLDRNLLQYLEAELRREAAQETLITLQSQVAGLDAELADDNRRLGELENSIAADRRLRDQLRDALSATEEGKLFLHLRGRNNVLAGEIEQLKQIGRTVQDAVALRVRNADRWLKSIAQLPVTPDAAAVRATEQATLDLADADGNAIQPAIRKLAAAVQTLIQSVKTSTSELFTEESRLERERIRLKELLDALRLGVVPEASVLLNTLNQSLPRRGPANAAQALRELCEVNDESWRPAVEVAFGRKFAVVVDPADYDEAERLYHELKLEAPRESLIHPEHALALSGEIRPGSLAEKIDSTNPVAQAVVRQTLGDLMCVETPGDLRKHHRAILADGFQYQRPFVERRAHYKNNPCVGKRGLEKQRQFLQEQLDEIALAQKVLAPRTSTVREFSETARTCRLDSDSIHDDLAKVAQLGDKARELQENIAQMNRIRDLGLEEKEGQIAEVETRVAAAEAEQKNLLQSSKQGRLVTLRHNVKQAEERLGQCDDRFRRLQAEGPDFSLDAGRHHELRDELLTERPTKELAAELARERYHHADKEALRLRQQLVDLRRELALAHPGFAEFDPELESNDAYKSRLTRIAEGDIPTYQQKAQREQSNWQHLFRTQVLAKLHAALFDVENLLAVLNQELRAPIGHNRYQITRRANPDREYEMYRNLVDASAAAREDELFFASMDADVRQTIEDIFHKIIDQPESREVLAFLDYRNYHDYDMHVSDTRTPDARPTSVDRHSGKFSGGENQSPYFIAILACYLRAYHRYERRRRDPSLALVPIDEAFSKLSGERIRDCIGALKQLDLQGVFSMSSGNIPYAMDMCDQMITVMKRERSAGQRHTIRNIPVLLTREEAMTRYGAGS